jgi:transposase
VFKVEVYARVRRAVQVDGMSIRQAAREFGLARKTIRKMLAYSVPPGYERKKPVQRPKLGPWLGVIDQILEDDKSQPKKQRHTAKRIWDRLKAEHRFGGGYTVVKDYVREARLRHKEVFVPLVHPPGDAQADFGEALVVIGGVEQKGHFLCMDLPHSDDCFVMAFPAENTESFLEGHNHAFAYFSGVPRTILYDNTKIAVKEILGGGERKPTRAFSELQSHCLFAAKFGRPGKGNDKGNVEGLVGYARRNFMVPVPRVASWEELNVYLLEECRKRRERKLWGHKETIAQRFERDREKLLPLPASPYEACEKRTTRVSSQALVRYETNDYSVPVEYGHRQVLVKAFVWELVISSTSEVIARHTRSYGREEMIFRCTIYPYWNRKLMRWTRRRRWKAGSCRRDSQNCGGRWKGGWGNADDGSMCRSCVCSRRFHWRKSRRECGMHFGYGRSLSMPSSIWCCVRSSSGPQSWIWRTIRIFLSQR